MSEIALNIRSRSVGYTKLLIDSFLAHSLVLAFAVFALVVNFVIFQIYPQQASVSLFELLKSFCLISLPLGLVLVILSRSLELFVYIKPKYPLTVLKEDLLQVIKNPAYLINGLPVVLAFIIFTKASLEFKPEIPIINSFRWDQTFFEWDRALHFGVDPWRIVQTFMGYPIVTYLATISYNLWILILTGIWVVVAFRRTPDVLQTRFVIASLLTWWIGGCLLAALFSSAGPAFFGKLGLGIADPYADLLAYLGDMNTTLSQIALHTQDALWAGYLGKTEPLGISAFPSMHNASAVLFALMYSQVSKGWGRFFIGYAVIIFLTSIHLGWHYAVDGYAGGLVAIACWQVAAPLALYVHSRPAMKRLEEGLAAFQS